MHTPRQAIIPPPRARDGGAARGMMASASRSRAVCAGAALVLAWAAPSCAPTAPPGCASCAAARRDNGWCDGCGVGFVAGIPMKSALLHDTMDAHGHVLEVASMACADCRRMAAVGGFCDACRIGWHEGLAYFSRLTYELARGRPTEPATLACAACRDHAADAGWCDACARGMIGTFSVSDRAGFDAGRRDFERMKKAIALAARCDYCAMAAVTDTACFHCKLTYHDGIASPTRRP